jgi:hypothetical protein
LSCCLRLRQQKDAIYLLRFEPSHQLVAMYASPSLPSPMAQQHIREAHHQRKPGELEDDGGIIAWVDATLAEKPARVLGPRVSVLGTKRACIGSITKLMHGSASTPSLSKKSHPQRQRGIPGEQQLRSHAYTSEQRGMLNAEQEQMGKGDQFWGIDAQAASEEESRDAMKIEDKFGRLLREYQKDLERLRELEEEMKIQKQKDAQARAEAEELARQLYLKDFYAEPSNLQAAAPFHSIAVGSPLHVANCCRNQQRRRVSFLGMSAGVSTEVLIAGSTQNESRPSSCSQYSLQNLSYKKKYQAYRRQRADMANASTSSESTHHNLDLNVESQLIHKVFAGIGAKAEEGMPVKEFLLRVRSMPSSAEALQRTMLWLIIKRRIWDELGGPSSVTVKALLEWSKLLGTQSHVPARLVRPMIEGHEVGMPCYPAFHVGEEVKVLAHGVGGQARSKMSTVHLLIVRSPIFIAGISMV